MKRSSLLADPGRLEELLSVLQEIGGGHTVATFFFLSRHQVPPALLQVLVDIRRAGVRVPLPVSDASLSATRRAVVRRLVRAAPGLTFTDLFTLSHEDTPRAASAAVQNVRVLGLFSWWNNDRCFLSPLPRQHRLYFPLPQGHGSFLPATISFNSAGSHPAEHKAKNKAKPQEPPGQDPSRRFVTVAGEYVDKDDYD